MIMQEILSLPAIEAAPLLLGCEITRLTNQATLKLIIVETEAYHQDDPASHTFRGLTLRTAPMFESGGHIYVYFTYGMHYCLNLVTGQKGVGEAVLIRAAEPIKGIEQMKLNRNTNNLLSIANGPGKLTQALGIKDTKLSGTLLNKSSILISLPKIVIDKKEIVTSPRIGISIAKEQPWRFYIKDNPYISKT